MNERMRERERGREGGGGIVPPGNAEMIQHS